MTAFKIDACCDCSESTEKKRLAILTKYDCITGTGNTAYAVPTGYVGFDFNLPAQYPMVTDATDAYLHGLSGAIWTPPNTGGSPSTPIIATDVLAIQSFLDSIAAPIFGVAAADVIWQVNNDNTITIWYNPAISLYPYDFWIGISGADNYTAKDVPSIATTYQPSQGGIGNNCTCILEYVYANDTYEYKIEDNGTLIPYTPVGTISCCCPTAEPEPAPPVLANTVYSAIQIVGIASGSIANDTYRQVNLMPLDNFEGNINGIPHPAGAYLSFSPTGTYANGINYDVINVGGILNINLGI